MTVRIYRSTDASAPTLSGSAGALVGVLDACLVNGYGSSTAAGWAIEFTGTNKRAYRAASGNRLRLRIDDSGTTTARAVGYESMSDVDTGTGDFPTAAQISGGLYYLKSNAADANARAWIVIATGTMFYMFINSANAGAGSAWASAIYSFGDFTSYKSGDAYNTRICALINTTNTSTNNNSGKVFDTVGRGACNGMYVARAHTQTGTSIASGQNASCVVMGTVNSPSTGNAMGQSGDWGGGVISSQGATYPNGPDGGIPMSRVYVTENSNAIRGYLPGLWCPGWGSGTPPSFGDTWSGAGDLSGKTFELVLLTNGSSNYRPVIETSDTW